MSELGIGCFPASVLLVAAMNPWECGSQLRNQEELQAAKKGQMGIGREQAISRQTRVPSMTASKGRVPPPGKPNVDVGACARRAVHSAALKTSR